MFMRLVTLLAYALQLSSDGLTLPATARIPALEQQVGPLKDR